MAYRCHRFFFFFFSGKSGQALCRNCHALLDNSMWIISCIVAIDQNAFGVSYSRWRQRTTTIVKKTI